MALGLGNIGDLIKLQREGKKMQEQMKKLVVEGSSRDSQVIVKLDGTMELVDIQIADELLNSELSDVLRKQILEAWKDAQKKMQKEMVKDMDLDKIKGLLQG